MCLWSIIKLFEKIANERIHLLLRKFSKVSTVENKHKVLVQGCYQQIPLGIGVCKGALRAGRVQKQLRDQCHKNQCSGILPVSRFSRPERLSFRIRVAGADGFHRSLNLKAP